MKKSQIDIALETLQQAAQGFDLGFSAEEFRELISLEATTHESKQVRMESFIRKMVSQYQDSNR